MKKKPKEYGIPFRGFNLPIDAFERTVILIDPKAKKNEGTDAQIDSFCESL